MAELPYQTWQRIMGTSHREARAAGLTDGSAAQNLALQARLLEGWRPSPQAPVPPPPAASGAAGGAAAAPPGELVYQTWQRIMGTPLSAARAAGLTDGSAAQNLALQAQLLAGQRPSVQAPVASGAAAAPPPALTAAAVVNGDISPGVAPTALGAQVAPRGELVYQTWQRIMGTPLSVARAQGLTDGSAEQNLALQARLLAGWRPGDKHAAGQKGLPPAAVVVADPGQPAQAVIQAAPAAPIAAPAVDWAAILGALRQPVAAPAPAVPAAAAPALPGWAWLVGGAALLWLLARRR